MVLSGAYAVADFMGSDALTIPQMARTHGILNAFGFCLLGLLGWLVENRVAVESRTEHQVLSGAECAGTGSSTRRRVAPAPVGMTSMLGAR